jgi:1-acyl-sn-glycerol-3-phosphate acyltransferase
VNTMGAWYHFIPYQLLRIITASRYVKKYNAEILNPDEQPKPPFLLLANHALYADPYIVGYFIRCPVAYVANVDAGSWARKLGSRMIGVIPKLKGVPDIAVVQKIITCLSRGHAVGLFPEGDRSWDGESERLDKNISRLVKRANAPVLCAHVHGNYLSGPRWAEHDRRGKVVVELKLLTGREIGNMNDDVLYKTISGFLYNNDVKNPKNRDIPFLGKGLAEGVQYLLWLCPCCNSQDSIQGEGDTIICSACNARWEVDGYQCIHPVNIAGEDLKDWSDWQKERIKELCINMPESSVLTCSADVSLGVKHGEKEEHYADGGLALYKSKLVFTARDRDSIEFEVDKIMYYVENFNENFQFSYKGRRYVVTFNGKNASKYLCFFRWLRHFSSEFGPA